MRTTINLAEDALIAARNIARRERISLGDAVSEPIRRGSAPGDLKSAAGKPPALRGRFALLPQRDEIVTPQHFRDLMEREDICGSAAMRALLDLNVWIALFDGAHQFSKRAPSSLHGATNKHLKLL